MAKQIAVTKEEKNIIKKIIKALLPAQANIYTFGSRTKLTHHANSDLDIAIDSTTPLSFLEIDNLQEAFSESDLPYKVDIVDLNNISPEFARLINNEKASL